MKYVSTTLFALLALLVTASLALAGQPDPPGGITPTPTSPPTAVPSATPTAQATAVSAPARNKACLRINFEVGGDVAMAGTYTVIEQLTGRELARWTAQDGWQDSAWMHDISLTYTAVHVQVFYDAGDGTPPIEMRIMNPAPGTPYGWVAEGMCHAVEVAWP